MAQLFGLRQTITSGNKFYDPGDAVSTDHSDPWPMYVDCKSTERASITLKVKDLRAYALTAATVGKRFVMPIRFWTHHSTRVDDYVLVGLFEFKELVDLARKAVEAGIR